MTISDAQFDAWLSRSGASTCVLIELEAWSGGGVVTRYASTLGFISAPTDSPANTAYDDILIDVPNYSASLSEQFRGYSQPASGEIIIDNSSGVRDAWLLDAWDGRPYRLYIGDLAWPKADFRLMAAGVIDDIVAPSPTELRIKIKDRQHLLNKPISRNLIGGTTANKEAAYPLCYGECFNVEPVLVEASSRTYAVHDGQIESVLAVYENGVAKGFTANLVNGTFTLSSAAEGVITADVKGSKAGGVYINKTADIVSRILIERAGLSLSEIDAGSISAFNVSVGGAVGIYVKDAATILDVLDSLVIGAGGFYSFDRAGKFYLDQFREPSGSPTLVLVADDVLQNSLTLLTRLLPSRSVRLAYKRQWTTQTSGLASGVNDARRAELSKPYLIAKAVNAVDEHLLAQEPPVENSLFVSLSSASAEAVRRAALFGQLRFVARAGCTLAPARVKLGDVVEVYFARFGLVNGRLARVVSINELLVKRRVEIGLFW